MPRGMPQIEITYEVDANGILQVSAAEKSTGKSEKITITNSSNKLSKEDIEKMVQEAEKFKEEDDVIVKRVEAKNKLESYIYNIKSTMVTDEKMKKTLGDDLPTVETTVEETIKWLDENQSTETSSYEEKLKEVEGILMPLVQKAYQSNMPSAPVPDVVPESSGPKIEEVD